MKNVFIFIFISIIIVGCASAPKTAITQTLPQPFTEGVYHKVSDRETLWRIAKTYNVEISKIVQANRLQDPSKIDKGQMLFIPGAGEKKLITTSTNYHNPSLKGFIWPVKGEVISYFGQKRHNAVNNGIDILAVQDTEVFASKDGIVSFCDEKVKGYGKTIIIEHDREYSTIYAYNSDMLVKAGERVKRGQAIAKVGKSSRSDAHALHFEIRKNQKPVNPFYYLP